VHGLFTRKGLLNLVALVGVQGGNALVPLLVVPFALAMMGPDAYAKVAIAEAISAIVLASVLFSFEIDGVARIAGMRAGNDRNALGLALSEIISARLVLFFAGSIVVLGGYWLLHGSDVGLLALWLLVPFGQIFHSYWFYQGIENNVPPAVITLLSRAVTVAIVVLFIRAPSDQYLLPLAVGAPFAIGGMVSTGYLIIVQRLRVRWAGLSQVFALLSHGKEVFAGNAAVMLYREMNIVILGIIGANAASIATYALIEKSIKMLQACTRPLSQLFFPKVLGALSGERRPTPAIARIIASFTAPQVMLVALLLAAIPVAYLVARLIWPQLSLFGDLPQLWLLVAIMAPATVIGLANFMFGTAGLNYLGERRYYFHVILITGVASVGASLALSSFLGAVGAAICFVGAEALLLILVLSRYVREVPLETEMRSAS
jgi:PST family polysaccharide transporter